MSENDNSDEYVARIAEAELRFELLKWVWTTYLKEDSDHEAEVVADTFDLFASRVFPKVDRE